MSHAGPIGSYWLHNITYKSGLRIGVVINKRVNKLFCIYEVKVVDFKKIISSEMLEGSTKELIVVYISR